MPPSRALMALLDNTVAVRRVPENALRILQRVVLGAQTVKSKRGEADEVAHLILTQLAAGMEPAL